MNIASTTSCSSNSPSPMDQQQSQVIVPIGTPPNLPRSDLLEGSRADYIKIGVPLYEAAIKGNWEAAKIILDQKPELIRFAITENYETPLHIAVSAKSTKSREEFVEKLVNMMEKKDLQLQNKSYNTALSLAAAAGNVKTAMIMVNKNQAVLEIPGSNRMMPLYVAALFAKPNMVRYLYDISQKMSGDLWTHVNRGQVLLKCVEADIFDVAVKIVIDHIELTAMRRLLTDVLLVLAQKTHALNGREPHVILRITESIFTFFDMKVGHAETESDALQLLRIIWQKVSIMPKSEIDDIIRGPPLEVTTQGGTIRTYPSRVLFVAAKLGNMRFIMELIKTYPDLIWKVDDKGQTIFHIAVEHRHIKIYRLVYEIGSMIDLITPIKDNKGNTILHLAAKSAKQIQFQNVSGVALDLQRELSWFKEVETMIPPNYRQRKNIDGETPQDLFTKKHQELVSKGEEWMKNTASQCMLVATLIATTSFAAGLTMLDGYNRKTAALTVFAISNALSLLLSSTSVLIFMYVLTSRYTEHDFWESIPKKLMLGNATLYLSIMTMTVAFIEVLVGPFLVGFPQKTSFVVTGLAAMLITIIGITSLSFLGNSFYSLYRSASLFEPNKCMLYDQKSL